MSLERLITQAIEIWQAGGWAMVALALNAFLLFALGVNLWMSIGFKGPGRVPESTWRGWIARPGERRGSLGEMIGFVMGAEGIPDMGIRFNEVRSAVLSPVRRDLRFMKRAVSAAPLLGLLGTVTGMLTTFSALATGSGGDKTMDLVAGGISEALITTETGLMIALPGLIFQYHLARERDKYEAFLAHLETACTQFMYKSGRARAAEGETA